MNIKSTAFIGAVCLNLGLFYYETHPKSINTDKFLGFLEALDFKYKCLEKTIPKRKYVVYLDRLSVHTCKCTKEYFDENEIEYLFAPVGSPEYNSIEYMFSALKRHVKSDRLRDMTNARPKSYDQYIDKAVTKITNEHINNYVNHVLKLFKITI